MSATPPTVDDLRRLLHERAEESRTAADLPVLPRLRAVHTRVRRTRRRRAVAVAAALVVVAGTALGAPGLLHLEGTVRPTRTDPRTGLPLEYLGRDLVGGTAGSLAGSGRLTGWRLPGTPDAPRALVVRCTSAPSAPVTGTAVVRVARASLRVDCDGGTRTVLVASAPAGSLAAGAQVSVTVAAGDEARAAGARIALGLYTGEGNRPRALPDELAGRSVVARYDLDPARSRGDATVTLPADGNVGVYLDCVGDPTVLAGLGVNLAFGAGEGSVEFYVACGQAPAVNRQTVPPLGTTTVTVVGAASAADTTDSLALPAPLPPGTSIRVGLYALGPASGGPTASTELMGVAVLTPSRRASSVTIDVPARLPGAPASVVGETRLQVNCTRAVPPLADLGVRATVRGRELPVRTCDDPGPGPVVAPGRATLRFELVTRDGDRWVTGRPLDPQARVDVGFSAPSG